MNLCNWYAPLNTLSYGICGSNILKSLVKLGYTPALFPIGPIHIDQEDAGVVQDAYQRSFMFDPALPSVRLWHQHGFAESIGWGIRCGWPIFELDEFTEIEKNSLNSLDHVFVCSEWAKKIILDQTNHQDQQVDVIPLGIDPTIFSETPLEPVTRSSATRFLLCGKWEIRKNQIEAIDAFSKAFDPSDDVELILHCHNPFFTPEETEKFTASVRSSRMAGKIMSTGDRNLTHKQVSQLYHSVDCGVFPSRAEGFNLPLLEMLACGKECIATDFAAHTEFATSLNAKLIQVDEIEPAYDGKWFNGQCGNWASWDSHQEAQLIHHMRAIHRLKQEEGTVNNINGADLGEQMTWDHTAQLLAVRLGSLTGNPVESQLCIGANT